MKSDLRGRGKTEKCGIIEAKREEFQGVLNQHSLQGGVR